MKKLSKKKKILIIILAVILTLVLGIIIAYNVMRYTGKKSLMKNDKIPMLPTLPEYAEDVDEETKTPESSEEYSVRYKGKKYKYNDSMINLLFMGTDNEEEIKENDFYGNGGQVDVLLLACVDTKNKTVKIVSIPRDTMCNVELFDYHGNSAGTKNLQISLSYAYGDGDKKSCEITSNAVSELLYGLPIHAWFSMNMSAIPTVNDSIGGVSIKADEKNLEYLPHGTKLGETVVLKGNFARKFIVHRRGINDSARRARQSQYLKSFITTAKNAVLKNPVLVVNVLDKINKYSITTLTVDEIVWLAGEIVGMDIDTNFITLKGTEEIVDNRVQYNLDNEFLYEMMLDIFYVEVK